MVLLMTCHSSVITPTSRCCSQYFHQKSITIAAKSQVDPKPTARCMKARNATKPTFCNSALKCWKHCKKHCFGGELAVTGFSHWFQLLDPLVRKSLLSACWRSFFAAPHITMDLPVASWGSTPKTYYHLNWNTSAPVVCSSLISGKA